MRQSSQLFSLFFSCIAVLEVFYLSLLLETLDYDGRCFMRYQVLRALRLVVCVLIIPMLGCNCDAPQGPEKGELQEYLDANPQAAQRIDEESETDETDGEG